MTIVPGFAVTLFRHDHDTEAAFTWRGRAGDAAEAQAYALEDAAVAWAATAYGRTGSPPEEAFAFAHDNITWEPISYDETSVVLEWSLGRPAIDRLPRRSGAPVIPGPFPGLIREAGLTDPAIRGMAIAGLPAAATVHVTSTQGHEGAETRILQDAPPPDRAPAPLASRLTLRALNALGAMNTGFASDKTIKIDGIVAECRFAVDSASVRAAIARGGAPDPARAAAILSAAGLGAIAEALRAQARTAHEEPA